MQISIQSLEIIYNKIPYRFLVKRVLTNNNEVSFHCWAPDDQLQSKKLLNNEILMFEWDDQRFELKSSKREPEPINEKLKEAIRDIFLKESA